MAITPLSTPPSRTDPVNFAARSDALFAALPQFVSEVNALQISNNTQAASLLAQSQVARDASVQAWAASMAPAETLPAISKSMHSGMIVKTFLYDTSKDSDGGAWRKRCADKSWYTESINGVWLGQAATAAAAWATSGAVTGAYFQNTTDGKFYALGASSPAVSEVFRGNVREFPEQVGIVVASGRVVVYDLSQVNTPMWRVFLYSGKTIVSAFSIDGKIFVASSTGLFVENLITDFIGQLERYTTTSSPGILNNSINDVAVAVLSGAPIDLATGLPTPTIYAFTAGGVSRLAQDGTVSSTASVSVPFGSIDGDRVRAVQGGIVATWPLDSVIPTPGNAAQGIDIAWTGKGVYYNASIPATLGPLTKSIRGLFSGANGITLIKENAATSTKSMVTHINMAFNSGWQVGDSRGAWLADTVEGNLINGNTVLDRSVKNNPLTVVGTVARTAAATGAQMVWFSGFGASNYLSQAYSANLDFGTGEFSIMGWHKQSAISSTEYLFNRDSSTPGKAIRLFVNSSGFLVFELYDGTTTRTATGAASLGTNCNHIACNYAAGVLTIYLNGAVYATASGAALLTLTNALAITRVGYSVAGTSPATNASLALLRASATAPSADQIAHIYRTELPLFQANAKCTIDGTSSAVTALAYDDTTDTLQVGTSWGRSAFRDLLRTCRRRSSRNRSDDG